MTERDRKNEILEADAIPERWNEIVDQLDRRGGRIVVKRDGKVVAAVISALDLERLQQVDRQRAELRKVVDEIRARNADMDPDEVERDIAEAIEEMRAERRAQASAPSPT